MQTRWDLFYFQAFTTYFVESTRDSFFIREHIHVKQQKCEDEKKICRMRKSGRFSGGPASYSNYSRLLFAPPSLWLYS